MAASTQRRILDLEKEYWSAIQRKDTDTIERLTDDPCIVVGPQGVSELTRVDLTELLRSRPVEIEDFDLDERHASVRALGQNVAVVAYPVHERMRTDGTPRMLDAFDSSVWVRRDGRWRCAAHMETIAGTGDA